MTAPPDARGEDSLEELTHDDKAQWIRLQPHTITGRRIRLPEIVDERRGYM